MRLNYQAIVDQIFYVGFIGFEIQFSTECAIEHA